MKDVDLQHQRVGVSATGVLIGQRKGWSTFWPHFLQEALFP